MLSNAKDKNKGIAPRAPCVFSTAGAVFLSGLIDCTRNLAARSIGKSLHMRTIDQLCVHQFIGGSTINTSFYE
jgi:hypothetical protein